MIGKLSDERRAEIKAAMQDVVDRMTDVWDAERRLESVIDVTVDDMGQFFQDYAVSDAIISDDDVEAFLKWARNRVDEPEAF